MAGRVCKEIDDNVVTQLLSLGFSFKYIADHLNLHRNTLLNWRKKSLFLQPKTALTNDQLDEVILQHIENQPRRGEKMIAAYLSSCGYRVFRSQLRASILRIDPDGIDNIIFTIY